MDQTRRARPSSSNPSKASAIQFNLPAMFRCWLPAAPASSCNASRISSGCCRRSRASVRSFLQDEPGLPDIRRLRADAQAACPACSTLIFATIPAVVPLRQCRSVRRVIESSRTARRRTTWASKVGIAWAGNPVHGNDRDRSIAMQALAPLAQVPGVRFFSLQKGEASRQAQLPLGDATGYRLDKRSHRLRRHRGSRPKPRPGDFN